MTINQNDKAIVAQYCPFIPPMTWNARAYQIKPNHALLHVSYEHVQMSPFFFRIIIFKGNKRQANDIPLCPPQKSQNLLLPAHVNREKLGIVSFHINCNSQTAVLPCE